jgi:hypothetical protein
MVFPLPSPITATVYLGPPGSNRNTWWALLDGRTALLWLGMITLVLVVGLAVWRIGKARRRAKEKPQDGE